MNRIREWMINCVIEQGNQEKLLRLMASKSWDVKEKVMKGILAIGDRNMMSKATYIVRNTYLDDATWGGRRRGAMLFLEIAEVAPDLVREKPEYWRKYLPRSRNEGYKEQIHLDRTIGHEDESIWYGGFDAHNDVNEHGDMLCPVCSITGQKYFNGEPFKETDF